MRRAVVLDADALDLLVLAARPVGFGPAPAARRGVCLGQGGHGGSDAGRAESEESSGAWRHCRGGPGAAPAVAVPATGTMPAHERDGPSPQPEPQGAAAGRRLQLPVPRLPCHARPAGGARRPDEPGHRRHPRHDQHAAEAAQGRARRLRGLRVRRAGQDLPRRPVPRVQGQPLADAATTCARRSSRSTKWCGCWAGRC